MKSYLLILKIKGQIFPFVFKSKSFQDAFITSDKLGKERRNAGWELYKLNRKDIHNKEPFMIVPDYECVKGGVKKTEELLK